MINSSAVGAGGRGAGCSTNDTHKKQQAQVHARQPQQGRPYYYQCTLNHVARKVEIMIKDQK